MQQGSGRASPSVYGRERCSKGGREAPGVRVRPPSPPPLYIGTPGGAPALGDGISWGAAIKGGNLPPKASGGAPSPRVPNPRRRVGPRGGAPAHQGLVPLPLQPMGPSGIGGPTRWSRYNTDDSRNFPDGRNWSSPIYKSSPPDHSETPRDVRDPIWDSEQLSVCCIQISLQP